MWSDDKHRNTYANALNYKGDVMASIKFTVVMNAFSNTTRYNGYGEVVNGSTLTPCGYNGAYTDEETGFQYLGARYYDPQAMRFTQEDTFHGDGWNFMTYCGNDPINYADPTGYWKDLGNNRWQAQSGDNLWRLANKLTGDGLNWKKIGFARKPESLRIGEIVDVSGMVGGGGSVSVPAPNTTPGGGAPSGGGGNTGGGKTEGSNSGGSGEVYGPPGPNGSNEVFGPPAPPTNLMIWNTDPFLSDITKKYGFSLKSSGRMSIFKTPAWLETLGGFYIEVMLSASFILGTGPFSFAVDKRAMDLKFGKFTLSIDDKYTTISGKLTQDKDRALYIGCRNLFFTTEWYMAYGYSPFGGTFSFKIEAWIRRNSLKELTLAVVLATLAVYGWELAAILGPIFPIVEPALKKAFA